MMNGETPVDVGWLFGLLILAIIIGLLIRGACRPGNKLPPDDALEILKQRYANGEITDAEFDHMKKELEK